MTVLIIGVLVVVAVVAALILLRRRPQHEPGVTRFQRHIGALSPEARREVLDRARRHPDDWREQLEN